jgi:TolB-like protein
MKLNAVCFLGMCLAVSMAIFSCASTGGGNDADLSLEQAIEQSAVEFARKLPAGIRVAVVSFTTEYPALSAYIMDELPLALADGSLEVTDRQRLELVKREQGFQLSGDVSDETAVSIGKILGTGYVITGQLVKAGGRYRYRVLGINVETAALESPTRLNVRDDRDFQTLLADLQRSQTATTAAGYGERTQNAPVPSPAPVQPQPPVTPPPTITETIYVDGFGQLTYSLSNSRNEIERAIYTRTSINVDLDKVNWILNTGLSENVKNVMNNRNVNYSMTIAVNAGRRYFIVNKRENNRWFFYIYYF